MKLSRFFNFIPLLILGNLLISCSTSGSEEQQVSVDGGAVGFSLSLAVAEEYQKVNPNAKLGVASSGTGGGFTRLCNGSIDIAGASRVIRDSETEACKKNGIEYLELPMALDGLALVANRENKFLKCLTLDELKKSGRLTQKVKSPVGNKSTPLFQTREFCCLRLR